MKNTKKNSTPEQVELTQDEVDQLKEKIKESNLDSSSQELILKSLQGMIWLSKMLRAKKLSIRKLTRLFGIKTEKKKKDKPPKDGGGDKPGTGKGGTGSGRNGKNGHDKYTGAKRFFHEHEELSQGDRCPDCKSGNLYEIDPGVFLNIKGSTPLTATVHEVQKLRCATCGKIFTAEAPKDVRKQQYDETADVTIALMRYGLGTPLYRMSTLQKYLGVPLAASTAWERIASLADAIWPVFHQLIKESANANKTFIDDTTGKILDLKKKLIEEESKRVGIYTTGIVAQVADRVINLFFTGNRHAGENLDRILQHRDSSLPDVIRMSDALANNNTKEHSTLKCLCLTHCRRNFIDCEFDRPKESEYVVHLLGKIYHNDNLAAAKNLTDDERLLFHQKKSKRVIKQLRRWCLKMIYLKKIEPNEPFGEAIQYLFNHWEGLTEFLRTPGAPIDNTIAERLIKRAILHRKNSLFFKTTLGAYVGDLMMSLIETCKAAGENPYDYLLTIYKRREDIRKNPQQFLPWNYKTA